MPQTGTSARHVSGSTRKQRLKVKTGCRTCKIRKLKCDEGFPSCQRCISTGRLCDGYGVWGGGGQHHVRDNEGNRVVAAFHLAKSTHNSSLERNGICSPSVQSPQVVPTGASSLELEHFDWLRVYAIHKLPGSCPSNFWTQLLLQATITEPAVWHAVMAMSSFHKANSQCAVHVYPSTSSALQRADRLALEHYCKSIRFLQPHFDSRDRASLRTTLITCIVFLCLELLRGHLITAKSHLESGLRILAMKRSGGSPSSRLRLSQGESFTQTFADDQIEETLLRFRTQFGLYQHLLLSQSDLSKPESRKCIPTAFKSLKDAWISLDDLSNCILVMRNVVFRSRRKESNYYAPHETRSEKSSLVERLEHWLSLYTSSKTTLAPDGENGHLRAYQVLLFNHSMLHILLETAAEEGEMKYDSHNCSFLTILEQVITLWKMSGEHPAIENFEGATSPTGRSIIDNGCIAPLYFTATKCRVHRIRLQAVRLLEAAGHREGFWSAKDAAHAARKVMNAEEGDYFAGLKLEDDFDLTTYPSQKDLSLPILPASRRIHLLSDVLIENPLDCLGDTHDVRHSVLNSPGSSEDFAQNQSQAMA